MLTIALSHPCSETIAYDTGFTKWYAEERDILFQRVYYSLQTESLRGYIMPKLSSEIENNILKKMTASHNLGFFFKGKTNNCLFYRIGGGRYWKIFTSFSPEFILNDIPSTSSRENHLYFDSPELRDCAIAVLSSSLFFWYFIISTNCRDLNPSDLKEFNIDILSFKTEVSCVLVNLSQKLMEDYKRNSIIKEKISSLTGKIKYQEFYPRLSKPIIDKIDEQLARHYGFTEEELDFIINYDINYRMGDKLSEE